MIRIAEIEDVETVVKSVSGFMDESKHSPFSIEKSVESWKAFISSGIGAMFILDDFSGALGGVFFSDPHRNCLVASEFFWYVQPEHRGKGGDLLAAFESWAKENGCQRVIMTHLADSMPDSLKKYYERKGYEELETNYIKEVV
jgi:GNAT superfamily N-acetyltransferase